MVDRAEKGTLPIITELAVKQGREKHKERNEWVSGSQFYSEMFDASKGGRKEYERWDDPNLKIQRGCIEEALTGKELGSCGVCVCMCAGVNLSSSFIPSKHLRTDSRAHVGKEVTWYQSGWDMPCCSDKQSQAFIVYYSEWLFLLILFIWFRSAMASAPTYSYFLLHTYRTATILRENGVSILNWPTHWPELVMQPWRIRGRLEVSYHRVPLKVDSWRYLVNSISDKLKLAQNPE